MACNKLTLEQIFKVIHFLENGHSKREAAKFFMKVKAQ